MLLKDFIEASYAELQIFKDGELIYIFDWNDYFGEENFIDQYGYHTVASFNAVTAGIVKVIITK